MNTIGGQTLINESLPYTLISPREFDKDGMYTIFGGNKVIVTDTNPNPDEQSIVMTGEVQDDLYVLPSSIVQTHQNMYTNNNNNNTHVLNTITDNKGTDDAYITEHNITNIAHPNITFPNNDNNNTIPCEHYMFGHISHDKLESIIPNVTKFLMKQCHTCMQTKMKKKPVKSTCTARQDHYPGQIFYVDTYTWDIASHPHQYKYISILIDSNTRKKFKLYHNNKKAITKEIVQFIQDHNITLNNIRTTNAHAPVPIQILIVDQGKELYNDNMRPQLRSLGVELRTVPKNTPEMMLCERAGQTIGNMTRCLLQNSGLPKTKWPLAMDDAFFIANNIPTTKHKTTPNTAWGLRHRAIDTYKPLGCSALAHDPRENKPKSHDRAIECIIIGTRPLTLLTTNIYCST